MRILSLSYIIAVAVSMLANTANAAPVVYLGNTNAGFGGTVGGGSLSINDVGADLNFVFSRGAGTLGNALVIYIDSVAGGFGSTSSFTDTADGLRRAISGNDDGPNQTVATFASGFNADYAIAFDASFAGLWTLQSGSHTFIAALGLSPTGNVAAASHSFSVAQSDLGLGDGASMSFVGTYISDTGFRSNEAIGSIGAGGNPGFTGGITFTDSRSFTTTAVPEPTSMILLSVAGLGFAGMRLRKRTA